VKVLMERAKKILEDTFDRNGITMMLRAWINNFILWKEV
jgi:hypothetical protein